MSRFLLATMPITGHVAIAREVARALIAAGHEVHWYCGQKFRRVIEATGVQFLPRIRAHDDDDAQLNHVFPQRQNLAGLDLMITNGGYGGVHFALTHGIPLITAGDSEEKPEVCSRIEYFGVGINLKTKHPTPEQIRLAAKAIFSDHRFQERAQTMRAELQSYNGPILATSLLEKLAKDKAPVLREDQDIAQH